VTCNVEQLKFWSSAQLPCSFPQASDHIVLSAGTGTLEKASGANFFRIQDHSQFRSRCCIATSCTKPWRHIRVATDIVYRHFKSHGNTDTHYY